jgi:hypothetical protein
MSCAALALIGAGAAMADTASVEITATQEETCTINASSTSSSIALGAVDEAVAGVFEYQCNFVGSPTLTFTSTNGGVSNGTDIADYGIYLNDTAPSSAPSTWLQASAATGSGAVYNNITSTTAANTNTPTNFSVGLTEALPVAGDYSDTLTIDLVP